MVSAVVEVTDQDIEGLTLVLAAGAKITGRIVTDREEANLDWRRISLYMDSIVSAWRYAGGGSFQIEGDFTFKIKDVPEATYRFVVRLLPRGNHYVESIRFLTKELTDRPIEIRSGDRLDGVEIHISSAGTQISGVVEKEEGREVAQAATALVFAADSEYRGPTHASPGGLEPTSTASLLSTACPGIALGVRSNRSRVRALSTILTT